MTSEEEISEAERTARIEQAAAALRATQEPVEEARRRLNEVMAAQMPKRDEAMLVLRNLGLGPTEIGMIIGVKRQTAHAGIVRARSLARTSEPSKSTPNTPDTNQ